MRTSNPEQLYLLPEEDTLYEALMQKDSSFEGLFYVGVRTTGIFCRPTCRAKKPKRENVEFFASCNHAVQHGYRPCKMCNPLGEADQTPEWLQPLLQEIEKTPNIRLFDRDLRQRGLDPARIRRWFKKHHGMTFQTYLRTQRIGSAFGRIKHGERVTDTAFDSGYESLSGFTSAFKNTAGFSPKQSKDHRLITVTRITTALGPMLAGATEQGICLLEFVDRRMLETQIQRLQKLLKAQFVPGNSPWFDQLNRELSQYFAGERQQFRVPLDVPGTPFQKQVWACLQTIPYGETRSYEEQAIVLGNPKAIRAVARANGDNRIGIIVPCHRVIGKDGKLVGYGGGLWRKKHLLNLEQRALSKQP